MLQRRMENHLPNTIEKEDLMLLPQSSRLSSQLSRSFQLIECMDEPYGSRMLYLSLVPKRGQYEDCLRLLGTF